MRAIDADALSDILREQIAFRTKNLDTSYDYQTALSFVENMPTIELQHKNVYCPNCGADMRTPVETARDIVHEAIDNSVWADSVDVSEMHKVVDDKYAEMGGQDDRK